MYCRGLFISQADRGDWAWWIRKIKLSDRGHLPVPPPLLLATETLPLIPSIVPLFLDQGQIPVFPRAPILFPRIFFCPCNEICTSCQKKKLLLVHIIFQQGRLRVGRGAWFPVIVMIVAQTVTAAWRLCLTIAESLCRKDWKKPATGALAT